MVSHPISHDNFVIAYVDSDTERVKEICDLCEEAGFHKSDSPGENVFRIHNYGGEHIVNPKSDLECIASITGFDMTLFPNLSLAQKMGSNKIDLVPEGYIFCADREHITYESIISVIDSLKGNGYHGKFSSLSNLPHSLPLSKIADVSYSSEKVTPAYVFSQILNLHRMCKRTYIDKLFQRPA